MKLVITPLIFTAVLFSVSAFATPTPTYTSKKYTTKHFTGFVRTAKTFEFLATAPRSSFSKTDTAIPGTYTMRGKAGPVEDQGQCGSCWDFSLTSVLRGTSIMGGNDPGRLSFNYLLNCATDQAGCNGGDFNAAAWFITPKGAPAYGSDGAYTAGTTGTGGTCSPQPALSSATAYHMLGASGTTPSFKDIAYVVSVLQKPVSIDVAVDIETDAQGNQSSIWENYVSGVYNTCNAQDPSLINHMVAIEGYDCETSVDKHGNCVFDANGNLPPGVGTWLVRNSWSDTWGDGGYITTKATDAKGVRCNEVANDALYFDTN